MSDEVTTLKATLYEKQEEIEKLKKLLQEKDAALSEKEAKLTEFSDDDRQKALNDLLRRLQDKDGEIRRLIDARGRRDDRIENLERQVRNQKRTEETLMRQYMLAHRVLDMTLQITADLAVELGTEKYNELLPQELRDRIQRLVFPATPIHVVDFSIQLSKWADDNPQFKKLLSDMGFGAYEQIALDLSKPLIDPEEAPEPAPAPAIEQP